MDVRLLRALVLACLLLPLGSFAQDALRCNGRPTCGPEQNSPDGVLCGKEQHGETATGEWRGWWYPHQDDATKWCRFTWAGLTGAMSRPSVYAAVARTILNAPSVAEGIALALDAYSIRPPAGSRDEYELRLLHHTACLALGQPWPAWVAPLGTGEDPAAKCGTAPVPPPPPTDTYAVIGVTGTRSAFPVLNGRRSTTPGAQVPVGTACDCAALAVIEFGVFRYCAVPVAGATQPMVAACTKR